MNDPPAGPGPCIVALIQNCEPRAPAPTPGMHVSCNSEPPTTSATDVMFGIRTRLLCTKHPSVATFFWETLIILTTNII